MEIPQRYNHSCLNWDIGDNDSIITLCYKGCGKSFDIWPYCPKTSFHCLRNSRSPQECVCGLGWLMPPYRAGYVIRRRVMASGYNLLQKNLWLTRNDGTLGWALSKSTAWTSCPWEMCWGLHSRSKSSCLIHPELHNGTEPSSSSALSWSLFSFDAL